MMRRLRMLHLLVLALLASVAGAAQPLIFLGDKNLRPYEYLEDGQPKGANVDLALAIGRELGRAVQVRLMGWEEAQAELLAGKGDALTMLGHTPDREKFFAFSQSTTPVSFALFVRAEDNHRFLGDSLAGKIIGVTKGGLARNHLQTTQPQARYVEIENLLDGMQRLVRHEVDAVAAQEWSAYHLLNEMGIRGVVGLDPFLRRQGNMAVRKEDAALAAGLDGAITRIKASGEFDRILDRWSHTRVHLLSQQLANTLTLIGITAVIALLLLTATLLWQRGQRLRLALEVEQRRELEQRLRASEAELREADRQKDRFLATLAHELRNPLAPMSNALAMLRRSADPALARRASEVMERQLSHLVRLVDDLLDVNRIKHDKLELRKSTVDIATVIQAAIEISRPQIEHGEHKLEAVLPEEPILVNGDQVRLTQVVANLLNNAARYSPQRSRIEVRVSRDDGNAVVIVKDNGIGIVPESLGLIFEMFQQVSDPLKRSQGGLGIGLALVRRLVELHGGTVKACSDGLGQGLTVTVRIPALSGAAARAGTRTRVVAPTRPSVG